MRENNGKCMRATTECSAWMEEEKINKETWKDRNTKRDLYVSVFFESS